MVVHIDHLEQNIMLVTQHEESHAPLVAVIRTILQQLPNVIQPAKAQQCLQEKSYDLIIADVHSHETTPLIRSFKERFPCIPVIAIVAYGNISMVEAVLQHGADDYISQPISLERLKTTLRNALRMRNLMVSAGHGGTASYPGSGPAQSMRWMIDADGKWKTLREIEDVAIEQTIRNCNGCITKAARMLGVGRSTLYRKIQEKNSAAQTARDSHATRPMMAVSSIRDS